MSIRNLEILVGKAVVSDQFRAGILNGRRAELLHEFDLEPDEASEVLAIQADTLAEFSAAIERIVHAREALRAHTADNGKQELAHSSAGAWWRRLGPAPVLAHPGH
jgi:hypothetical protein